MRELLCGQTRAFWQKRILDLKNFYIYDFSTPHFDLETGFCLFIDFSGEDKAKQIEDIKIWLRKLGPQHPTAPGTVVFDECLYVHYSETGAGGLPHLEARGSQWANIADPEITAIHKLDALFEKAGFKSMPPPEYYRGNCYPELP